MGMVSGRGAMFLGKNANVPSNYPNCPFRVSPIRKEKFHTVLKLTKREGDILIFGKTPVFFLILSMFSLVSELLSGMEARS